MASSSSSSSSSAGAGVGKIANEIHDLVERCCPKLRNRVEHWLRCYQDPQLLYESLRREYGLGPSVQVVDDSDDEGENTQSGLDLSPPSSLTETPAGASHPHNRRKVKLCEAHLLQKCRWGEDCRFAHSDEQLRDWKRRRWQADGPKKSPVCPDGASYLHVLPSDIAFCHDTVAPDFKNGRSILTTLLDLASGDISLRDVSMMEVVFFQDRLHSLSNRRLCLYMLCEHYGLIDKRVPVKVILLEKPPHTFKNKYTTTCRGEWVRVRRDGRICSRQRDETTFGRDLFT